MGSASRRAIVVLAGALLAVLGGAAQASAASTYTVSGFADVGGSCTGTVCPSLRAAVTAADANPGSTISLGAGTYTLSFGELAINVTASSGDALTIVGAGPTETKIQQTGPYRVLDYQGGGPYLLKGLEVTGGNYNPGGDVGYEGIGGGISDDGDLSLDHVTIIGNSVTGGPGGAGSSPTGGGSAFGGGLSEDATGDVTIVDSTISGNTVTGGAGAAGGVSYAGTNGGQAFGGGISFNGSVTIVDSTISGNRAVGGAGGGSVTHVAGNGASVFGGGIDFDGTLDMVNSTVAGNSATGGAAATGVLGTETSNAGASTGGGLTTFTGADFMLLYSDTIDGNTAGVAGNVYSGTTTETIVLDNTAIADGVATDDATATTNNCQMRLAPGLAVYDHGDNLETDSAPASGTSACDLGTGENNVFATSAGLGPLADNGGPTQTELPQAGSPLLRAGGTCLDRSQTPAVPLTTDQRGEPRGATCDIGAVQVQAAAAVGQPSLTGTASVGQTLTCSAANTFSGEGLSYSYAWLRDGTAIPGQTGTTYSLQAADVGTSVTCSVTAAGIAGPPVSASASVSVPATAVGEPGPPTYPVHTGNGAPPATTPIPGTTTQKPSGVPKLLSTKLVDSGGKTKLKLFCPAGTSGCAGKLKLTFIVKKTKKKTTTVKLASGSFQLMTGESKTLTLKLSRAVARLLASHHHRLGAKLTLSPSHGTASTLKVTITPAPKKHTR